MAEGWANVDTEVYYSGSVLVTWNIAPLWKASLFLFSCTCDCWYGFTGQGTVTLFARFLGLSGSRPFSTASS